MDNQRKIARNYISELARLIAEENWNAAEDLTKKFQGMCRLWSINQQREQEAALKDGSAKERFNFKYKQK